MWIIPSWAIGVGFVMIVIGTTQVVARRLLGRTGWSPSESRKGAGVDLSGVTTALEDVQRRLGELEERMDFAERLLAKERSAERIAPPGA